MAGGPAVSGPRTNPRSCNPSASQREVPRPSKAGGVEGRESGNGTWPPGGSETTSRPPTLKKGAPHSAVTAGRPKPRATTTSMVPLSCDRPASSALTGTICTLARSGRCRARAWPSHRLRVTLPSSRYQLVCGHMAASTRPGRPAPVPRSRARAGGRPIWEQKPPACANCCSTGPGPKRPRWRAATNSSRSARRCPGDMVRAKGGAAAGGGSGGNRRPALERGSLPATPRPPARGQDCDWGSTTT
jgi:hypothetical protein